MDKPPYKIRIVDTGRTTVSTLQDGSGINMDFTISNSIKYADGYLYASEQEAHVVSKVNIETKGKADVACKRGTGGFADGQSEAALFRTTRGIDVDELGENTFTTVYNLQGMQLKKLSLKNNRTNQISIAELSKGIYLLNIQNASCKFNKKIVVN